MKNKKNFIFPLVILFSSIILIFYKFPSIPKYLAFDEVEFTKLALSLENKPYIPYSPLATGHSTLYFYILLFSLKIFGINTFALRVPSAIFGILSVLVFYFIINLLFSNKWFSFILSLILLTSRWFLNFSRFSFEVTFLLFLELTSIYFFINSVKTKSKLSLILSGIFAGLAFNSYTPGRIFFLLPLGFLIFRFVNPLTRKQYNAEIKQLFYFIIPLLIVITPLIISLSSTKDTRIDQLFFWRNNEMTLQQKINGTLQNISSLTLMFFVKGDMNGRHNYPGKPALNPVLDAFFILGLIFTIKNWQNPINLFAICYFLFSIIPALLTYPWENPSMLRTFTVIPSIVYFIGQGLIIISKLSFIIPRLPFVIPNLPFVIPSEARNLAKRKILVYSFLFLVILFSSFYELRTYFKYQTKVFEEAFEIKYSLDKAIKMKNPYEKINKKDL